MRAHSTTGLNKEQFNKLVRALIGFLRVPRDTGRRPFLLSLADQVELILLLFRHNVTEELAGAFFGVIQATVSRIKGRVMVGLVRWSTGRDNYSGKRRRQRLNIHVAATTGGRVLALSDPTPGSFHDFHAFAESEWGKILSPGRWSADKAYTGTYAITPYEKPQHRELTDAEHTANTSINRARVPVERAITHLKT